MSKMVVDVEVMLEAAMDAIEEDSDAIRWLHTAKHQWKGYQRDEVLDRVRGHIKQTIRTALEST